MAYNRFNSNYPKATSINKSKSGGFSGFANFGKKVGNALQGTGLDPKTSEPTVSPADKFGTPKVEPFNASAYTDAYTTNNQYDPNNDPLLTQAQKSGQLNLDAGLMALQNLFGEQRKGVEGRAFNQGLSGSGIQEGIWGQQYRNEGSDVTQLTSENAATTQDQVTELMNAGYDRYYQGLEAALQQDMNEIDAMYKEGLISNDERRLAIEERIAENDAEKNRIEQQRVDAITNQTFFPEGGSDAIDYYESSGGTFGGNSFADTSGLGQTQNSQQTHSQLNAWNAVGPNGRTYRESYPGDYDTWKRTGQMPNHLFDWRTV